MERQKGYTLVELLIVILIVAILAAVAIPLMRGRIDSAKWSEGQAMAGSIATAIRSWVIMGNEAGTWTELNLPPIRLGLRDSELSGMYFDKGNFQWQVQSTGTELTYLIVITRPEGVGAPEQMTLSSSGKWNEIVMEAK